MVKTELETKLGHILKKINNIEGIIGTIVVDNQSSLLYENLNSDDATIFGSMANVISSSGEKLLNLSDQGEIDKVLVESEKGNAFFIGLHNSILLILADKSANIGLINLNAKKVLKIINDMDEIKSIPNIVEEEDDDVEEPTPTEPPTTETKEPTPIKTPTTETKEPTPIKTPTTETKEPTPGLPQVKHINIANLKKGTSKPSIKTPTTETKEPTPIKTPTTETKEPTPSKSISADIDTNKVIEIYEAIMYEMSMGASKIMGPAPAKGMLKTSLPYEQNKDILEGVEVKENSALDFDKVRENLEKIPLENRAQTTIDGFSEIIDAITEKYGKVMGYGAFRGMIRPEFKKIYAKYGETMEELGIKEKIHKELQELLS